jgi:glutathione S-transferase
MKLYFHPVSTTSRPVVHFAADNNIALDFQVVDIFKGEQMSEAYAKINPSKMIPVLEDGDFRLTESSAILKYLADKVNSPAYPKDLKQRARINEMMDWFNSNFYRAMAYGLVYPQVFPHLKVENPVVQEANLAAGKAGARHWLAILDHDLIGPDKKFLLGDQVTIADYLGLSMMTIGEIVRCDMEPYPNICRWIGNMKKTPGWTKTYDVFNGFVASVKDQKFRAA